MSVHVGGRGPLHLCREALTLPGPPPPPANQLTLSGDPLTLSGDNLVLGA